MVLCGSITGGDRLVALTPLSLSDNLAGLPERTGSSRPQADVSREGVSLGAAAGAVTVETAAGCGLATLVDTIPAEGAAVVLELDSEDDSD